MLHKVFTGNPITSAKTKISKLAFRNRFTFLERVAIEEASMTDSQVRVLLKDQESATFIDLSRVDTQQGIGLLMSKGLLTPERVTIILDPNISSIEEYKE